MTTSVHQAREALGHRLRDIRRDAGLSGRQLAGLAGWPGSKVSKIEYGRQTPSEDDIRAWCRHADAADQIPDLIATVRHVEAMYVEWRRMLGTGTRRRQTTARQLEAATHLMRWYEPVLLPGLLHTAEYAEAVLRRVIAFYRVPDDLTAGIAERMRRQQVLYRGDHRFHFVVSEQALHTMVGNTGIMIGQLDRLLAVSNLPRVRLGIVPRHAEYRVPTHQFIMYDDRLVEVETVSAELSVSQPREVGLYLRAFGELDRLASYGSSARELVMTALDEHRDLDGSDRPATRP